MKRYSGPFARLRVDAARCSPSQLNIESNNDNHYSYRIESSKRSLKTCKVMIMTKFCILLF